jgi:hypothetical protein
MIMIEFISGLLVDLCLIGGIILLLISLKKKFKEQRLKMIVISVILIAVGLIFLDTEALNEAYQRGREAAEGMMAE